MNVFQRFVIYSARAAVNLVGLLLLPLVGLAWMVCESDDFLAEVLRRHRG